VTRQRERRGSLAQHQAQLLALCKIKEIDWFLLAREAQRFGDLDRLLRGQISENSKEADLTRARLVSELERLDELMIIVQEEMAPAFEAGASLTTVIDDDYPLNLRLIHNLPPFLTFRGSLRADDTSAVAVVGTRKPTEAGLELARKLSTGLVEKGVTVLSGLAAGIDTAAHNAALEAGGRTVAVIGTGILRSYPKQNTALQLQIGRDGGAVVSQFFPSAPPLRSNFPLRNIVMSGMGQGTVVVEASHTSGARLQARKALEHGKKVFLPRTLVETYDWAHKYSRRPGAFVVDDVQEIVERLQPAHVLQQRDQRRQQLSMTFA
jgi:DNA processing protein